MGLRLRVYPHVVEGRQYSSLYRPWYVLANIMLKKSASILTNLLPFESHCAKECIVPFQNGSSGTVHERRYLRIQKHESKPVTIGKPYS